MANNQRQPDQSSLAALHDVEGAGLRGGVRGRVFGCLAGCIVMTSVCVHAGHKSGAQLFKKRKRGRYGVFSLHMGMPAIVELDLPSNRYACNKSRLC